MDTSRSPPGSKSTTPTRSTFASSTGGWSRYGATDAGLNVKGGAHLTRPQQARQATSAAATSRGGTRLLDHVPSTIALTDYISTWDASTIAEWLEEQGMAQHVESFRSNDITGKVLLDVDQTILKEMGITSVGDRVKLYVAIKKLKACCMKRSTPASTPQLRSSGFATSFNQGHSTSSKNDASPKAVPSGSRSRQTPAFVYSSQSYEALTPTHTTATLQVPKQETRRSSGSQAKIISRNSLGYFQPGKNGHSPTDLLRPEPPGQQPGAVHRHSPTVASFSLQPQHASYSRHSATPSEASGLPVAKSQRMPSPVSPSLRSPLLGSDTSPEAISPSHFIHTPRPSNGSQANVLSLESVKRKCVKFIGEDGQTRVINVSESRTADEILAKVLKKFNLTNDANSPNSEAFRSEWAILSYDTDGDVYVLSEGDLIAICHQPHRPERERGLILRRKHQPASHDDFRKKGLLQQTKTRKLEAFFGQTPPPSSTSVNNTSPQKRPDDGDARRSLSVSVEDKVKQLSPTKSGFLSAPKRIRNFFGQRPPSELISHNLVDYFPGTEKTLLEQTARNSLRRSRALSSIGSVSSRYSTISSASLYNAQNPPPVPQLPPELLRMSSGSSTSHPSTKVTSGSTSITDSGWTASPENSDTDESASLTSNTKDHLSLSPRQPTIEQIADAVESRRQSQISFFDSAAHGEESGSLDEGSSEPEDRLSQDYESADEGESHRSLSVQTNGLVDPANSPKSLGDAASVEAILHEQALSSMKDDDNASIKWIKGALIGQGSFGSVYLGMEALHGYFMAVKQVDLQMGARHSEERKHGIIEAMQREIGLLKDLQHPNIVQYLGSTSDEQYLNIFLEYVPGGSVLYLLGQYGAFKEGLVRNFVRQILQGLAYLHEMDIIHRDIKGANVLVDGKGIIKISDFGISKKVGDNLLSQVNSGRPSLQGSAFWMAPEVVKQTSYTKKADIWSLGCLIVEMLTGEHPFPQFSQMQAIFKIGSTSSCPDIPQHISDEAKDFLQRTFEIDHRNRPTAEDLLVHPFLKEIESSVSL